MKKSEPNLVAIIVKYDALLQRYARFLVKDPDIAAALVMEIFELVYEENNFNEPADELRRQLKTYTFKACNHLLRMQAIQKSINN